LQALVEPETAGDPMSAQKWVRGSLRQLSRRLTLAGHPVGQQTVGRLLTDLDYALRANAKKLEAGAAHPDRAAQFAAIAAQRRAFASAGLPTISVDTKQKGLVGNFKNGGRVWGREADAANVHDFLAEGLGRAVPYGIHDVTANRGSVCVGSSGDTPQFAGEAIARRWEGTGRAAYPGAARLPILADAGGSNGCRPRLWKQQLQARVCDRLGLTVTVCHDPTGCSKWNPTEHRPFGQISPNWAGKPLRTWEALLGHIRATTTTTGLAVDACLLDGPFPTGRTVSDAEMNALLLDRHDVCPIWNYTLRPRPSAPPAPSADPVPPELIPRRVLRRRLRTSLLSRPGKVARVRGVDGRR
jgi:Rhodopirellula transposase DDE domain